jgi:hypothetical protein
MVGISITLLHHLIVVAFRRHTPLFVRTITAVTMSAICPHNLGGAGEGLVSDQGAGFDATAGERDDAAPPVDAFNKMSIQVWQQG